MRQLEALEGVARLGLLSDDVKHRVDQLGPLGVVALRPVVTGAGLTEHEVVGPEELAEGPRAHGVHRSRLEVHQDGARDVATAGCLIEVAVDALQLQVGVAVVRSGGVDAVLIGDHLPELGPDLRASTEKKMKRPNSQLRETRHAQSKVGLQSITSDMKGHPRGD